MDAIKARKMAEDYHWTPEQDEVDKLILVAANTGKFSLTIDELNSTTQRYLRNLGYKVEWYGVKKNGHFKIIW
jgi:hypothetical protein